MSIIIEPSTSLVVYYEEAVIGYVSCDCCDCERSPTKPYHATPAGFAITMPTYHFRDLGAAVYALQARWQEMTDDEVEETARVQDRVGNERHARNIRNSRQEATA